MNLSLADKVARAVLYEGYVLYPYRPDTFKNRQRWTFGGLFPRGYSDGERWQAQCEWLVAGDGRATLDFHVRFLQVQKRTIGQLVETVAQWDPACPPAYCQVETLVLGERTLYGWQEAVEGSADFSGVPLADLLAGPKQFDFECPAWRALEPLLADTGEIAGVIERQRQALRGRLEARAEAAPGGQLKLRVRVSNATTPEAALGLSRDEAAQWSLASTHVLAGVRGGRFISTTEPESAGCQQDGLWPVLVGDEAESDLMLAAPIILYDYPQIAPESPGDLFDGTEIDEILSLRILTLSETEKAAMREMDERTRALLDRTENLDEQAWQGLHGALRGLKPAESGDD
jgi:hypothetical protein